MSRLWACDRCGITAPYDPSVTLPNNWKCVMTRTLPEVWNDVCPACNAELDQVVQKWWNDDGAPARGLCRNVGSEPDHSGHLFSRREHNPC
jgi:hypothetical protein